MSPVRPFSSDYLAVLSLKKFNGKPLEEIYTEEHLIYTRLCFSMYDNDKEIDTKEALKCKFDDIIAFFYGMAKPINTRF